MEEENQASCLGELFVDIASCSIASWPERVFLASFIDGREPFSIIFRKRKRALE